jgi:hypothetical protein
VCANGSCGAYGSCNDGVDGDGTCRCEVGWAGSLCNVCALGFYGGNCTQCPACVSGNCDEGLAGSGACTCATTTVVGALCDACIPGFFGATCTGVCPPCATPHGICDDGMAGRGTCTCDRGWAGALCSACAPGFFGSNCTGCPACVRGTCTQGVTGNGTCVCDVGWAGALCDRDERVLAGTPTSPPTDPAGSALSPGAAAGVAAAVVLGVPALAAVALMVWGRFRAPQRQQDDIALSKWHASLQEAGAPPSGPAPTDSETVADTGGIIPSAPPLSVMVGPALYAASELGGAEVSPAWLSPSSAPTADAAALLRPPPPSYDEDMMASSAPRPSSSFTASAQPLADSVPPAATWQLALAELDDDDDDEAVPQAHERRQGDAPNDRDNKQA